MGGRGRGRCKESGRKRETVSILLEKRVSAAALTTQNLSPD
jgi:hypothetical protein